MEFTTRDILVFIEQRNGSVQEVSFELLSEARKLVQAIPEKEFKVIALLAGYHVSSLAAELIAGQADEVICVDHPVLEHYSTFHYSAVLEQIVRDYTPDSLLIGATTVGRDLAPRVAARLNTGLTADATKIEMDPEHTGSSTLWVTRPAFGGNLYGTIVCPNTRPQMATIRPNVFERETLDGRRTGKISTVDYQQEGEDPIVFLGSIEKELKGINLTKANVILSAGRGMAKHFDLIESVASEIGAAVGASRGLVDTGVVSKDHMVGQTGKTVKPNIYIACGISGATQHLAGMDKSELIIAINTDPDAPIFSIANIGFVGKAEEILPLLVPELKRLNYIQ